MPQDRNTYVRDAIGGLSRAFGAATGSDELVHEIDPHGHIRFVAPHGRQIVADVVKRPSRVSLLEAWGALRAESARPRAVPVLVVPRLSPSLRDLAASEGMNWVDFAGNAHVLDSPLFLHVEGRREVRLRPGVSADPFAELSTNLVRALLAEPERAWLQKQLVARSGLSQPRTSKVLGSLEEMALVRRDEEGMYRVADSEGLLDAWADSYSYGRNELVPVHVSGEGMQLARQIDSMLDVTHWFTGLPAAWAYDQFARFRLVSVFVDADPEQVARSMGARWAERGANVHLLAAGRKKLEIGQSRPDNLPCVHPTQVYVDLLDLPERAHEAAEHLKPRALSWSGG